jgi:TPR repeat protein
MLLKQSFEEKYLGIFWLINAASQGHVEAQYNLGCIYKMGTIIEKNVNKAVYWLEKALSQGYVSAKGQLQELCHLDSVRSVKLN